MILNQLILVDIMFIKNNGGKMVTWNKTTASLLIKSYKLKFETFLEEKIFKIELYDKKEREDLEKRGKEILDKLEKKSELHLLQQDFLSDELHVLTSLSHDNIVMIINHQVALIEKFLIDLAKQERHIHNEPIPVTWNKNRHFTDCIQALRYILLLERRNDNLSQIKYWERLSLLRDLRQRFAHGIFNFELKQGEFDNYNNKFQKKDLLTKIRDIKSEKLLCRLNDDVSILKVLNDYYIKFLDDIESQFFK